MLLQFFKDWQRAQLAQQSALGAANDALVKEARFKGAAELTYGIGATFEYDEAKGLTFKQPDRVTRRTLAKSKGKV
jgi:hypothetical protein